MIAGLLVLVLLMAREAARQSDRESAAATALGVMLWPAVLGFGLVAVVRVAELVVNGA